MCGQRGWSQLEWLGLRDMEGIDAEIRHLKEVFRHNGYNRAIYHENKVTAKNEVVTAVAILPFQHTTSYRNSILLGHF
jgi:hypothetical protein